MLLKQLHASCKRATLPRLSWHLFRHLHATKLSHKGVPMPVVQAQLGHASPATTLGIYTHVIPSDQRKAVEELENFFLPP